MNRRAFLGTLVAGAIAARIGWAAERKDHHDEGVWEKLGEKTVGKKEERDVFEIHGKQRFTAIRFTVEKGEIEMEDIKLTFQNDETFSPNTKLVFKEGDRSRSIDLPGDARDVKAIRFLYRSLGHGEAVIAVFGKAK